MSEEGELTNSGASIFEFAGTGQNWIIKSGLVDKEVVKIVLGDSAKISSFLEGLKNTRILETVRSGITGISRGKTALRA